MDSIKNILSSIYDEVLKYDPDRADLEVIPDEPIDGIDTDSPNLKVEAKPYLNEKLVFGKKNSGNYFNDIVYVLKHML